MLTSTLSLYTALFLSCAPSGPNFGLSRAAEAPKTLVFNNATEPEYLDPSQATGHPDGRIIGELFDGLTEYDPVDLSPVPSHALSWEQHPDGRGYTFHLRQDALWSDGTPVTSADYIWSWEHVLNPVYLARYAQQLYLLERGQPYNSNRVMLLTQESGPFDAGAHLLASSNNLARLTESVDVDGVSVREGASLLVLEREDARVKLQVRAACPDLGDLALLLECSGETREGWVDAALTEPSWPVINSRVLKAPATMEDAQGKTVARIGRGDSVTLLQEEGQRSKVFYGQEEKTGWVLSATLTDPRGELVRYQVDQLPDVDFEGALPDPEQERVAAPALPAGSVTLGDVRSDPELLGLSAPDPFTLVVRLKSVAPYFLQLTSHTTLRSVPKQAWEAHGARWTRVENIVTSGPFLLKEHVVRDKFVLEKNPKWWGVEELKLDRVIAYSIDNFNTSANLYRAGYTDLVVANDLPVSFLPLLQDKEDFNSSPALSVYLYRFNTDQPPFDDVRVRQALALAINKDDIVQVRKVGELPATHLVPPGLPGYEGPEGLPFDPERARALLAEAGYPDGAGFPPFTILYNTQESHKLVAAVIQAQWKEHLGIEVELENREWKTYLKAVSSSDYQVARGGWIGDYLDPTTFLDMWIQDGGNNNTGWGDPAYDALLTQAANEPDVAERARILGDAEAMLNEQVPFIPLYWYVWYDLTQPDVQGIHPNLLDQHPLRFVSIER